ncbi:AI-2E family transporter [uncultured Clostridium sp.]|uniref:AI-2E family transporter n=1 Tax=uncultured Clostridium sp. TaxID=59620 RepID=UPI002624DBD4|nr:AI-2E family transporter [uncultured Clostridium sp.]
MSKLNKDKILEILCWIVGIIVFVEVIRNYFTPFIWILVIYFLGNPINEFLKKKIHYRGVCAAITILVLNVVIIISILYLGSTVYMTFKEIISDNLVDLKKIFLEMEENIELILGDINIIEKMKNILNFNYIKIGATSTGEGFLAYFIGNICTFFIFSDKEKIKKTLDNLMPIKINKRIIRILNNLKNMLKIQFLLLFISTLIIIIGFNVLRIDNAIFLGLICGILDILPYVGTIIVFIPIIIYNIIVKNYLISFGLICLYILVQIIREFLEAKLVSDRFNIHPLLSLLSLYIGVKIFGFMGIFIGPIFCMTLIDIIMEN